MGLNCNHILQGLENDLKIMENMEKPKCLAMQSLGVKGNLGEHGKFKQYPTLTPKMHLNSNSIGAQTCIQQFITTWNCII